MNGLSGYTGHLFEVEVLGQVYVEWDGASYVPYHKAVAMAKAAQRWNPGDPNCRAANDLHAEVAMVLELDDWKELQLFSSVGTPLDRFHGVDGFFEFRGRVVTIDVTTNGHKTAAKADFIVHPKDFEPQGRLVLARAIAQALAG